MGRSSVAVWLAGLLLCSLLLSPGLQNAKRSDLLAEDDQASLSSPSNLVIAFSNGPSPDDDIKGTYALTFLSLIHI